jgi:hypothetical protein
MVSHFNLGEAWFDYFRCDGQCFGLLQHNSISAFESFLQITTKRSASRDSSHSRSKACRGAYTLITYGSSENFEQPCNPLASVKVHGPSSIAKSPPPPSTSTSQENDTSKTSSTSKVKKGKAWHPTKAHTPRYVLLTQTHIYLMGSCRNVAARDWLSEHPGGTKEDFTLYYDSLNQAQIKDLKKRAADLVWSFAIFL